MIIIRKNIFPEGKNDIFFRSKKCVIHIFYAMNTEIGKTSKTILLILDMQCQTVLERLTMKSSCLAAETADVQTYSYFQKYVCQEL